MIAILWNIIATMPEHPKTEPKLDRTDRRILAELQRDGGLSNQDLAERVGLSPSPCSRRVRQLEEAGIIERRVTLLDRKKLGLTLTALIQISMDRHTPDRFETFESRIRQLPEVQECYLITGQDAHYQEFLLNKITRIEGVSGVHSSFVMRRVVDTTELPLGYVG